MRKAVSAIITLTLKQMTIIAVADLVTQPLETDCNHYYCPFDPQGGQWKGCCCG